MTAALLIAFQVLVGAQTFDKKLLFVGDSLTAGFGVEEGNAYPALVADQLRRKGWSVINGGVSGDTTAGGLRRIGWMLNRSEPDFVIIALGGNDMLRGLPTSKTKENLVKMVRLAKAKEIPVAVLGISAPANLGQNYESRFNALYLEIKNEEKIPLLENYIRDVAGKYKLNLPDGIHPNEKGHRLIAERVNNFLKPLLEKVGD